MDDRQTHFARIMVECGCTIEDVSVTLGMKLDDTIYAVAQSLKANPAELKRVRNIIAGRKLHIPAMHSGERSSVVLDIAAPMARAA